jgi:hypothetical protein
MKTIYSYYQSLQAKDQAIEFSKANIWKDSWTKAGWNPVMLNQSHAQISPQRIKITKKLMSVYPLLNREKNESQEIIQVRFNRLCALHAAGGGWMSDYDVVNTGFNNQIAQAYEGNSFVIAGSPANVMFVSKEICSAAMNKILNSELISENGIMLYEKDLFSPAHNLDVTTLRHAENYDEMKKIYEDYLTSK